MFWDLFKAVQTEVKTEVKLLQLEQQFILVTFFTYLSSFFSHCCFCVKLSVNFRFATQRHKGQYVYVCTSPSIRKHYRGNSTPLMDSEKS